MSVKSAERLLQRSHSALKNVSTAALTVVAVGPRVGRHGAVTGEVLPLLDAHAHVGARVLLAGGARAWEKAGGRRERYHRRKMK